MIEVSDPLPGSEVGYRTVHEILLDGRYIGYVEAGYLRKEDIKTFKKYTKRKLRVGQPFGVQIFIDKEKGGMGAKEIGNEGLLEIIAAVKGKLHGLEDRDIFIIEVNEGQKRLIGRAEDLNKPL